MPFERFFILAIGGVLSNFRLLSHLNFIFNVKFAKKIVVLFVDLVFYKAVLLFFKAVLLLFKADLLFVIVMLNKLIKLNFVKDTCSLDIARESKLSIVHPFFYVFLAS
jgi:hypothetical protein